jgi:hypothetical protein
VPEIATVVQRAGCARQRAESCLQRSAGPLQSSSLELLSGIAILPSGRAARSDDGVFVISGSTLLHAAVQAATSAEMVA